MENKPNIQKYCRTCEKIVEHKYHSTQMYNGFPVFDNFNCVICDNTATMRCKNGLLDILGDVGDTSCETGEER